MGDAPRQLPRADYLALKAATRALVEAAGGARQAATRVRNGIDAARLSRYGSPHEALFVPLDAIADLEAETGAPTVTLALAELAGFHLVERTRAVACGESLMRLVGALAGELGDVLNAFGAAQADGTLTAEELTTIDREAAEAEAQLAQLRADIAALRKGTIVKPPD